MTGEAGAEAAFRIGDGFDAECADLISRGTFTLDLDPLEMLLEVVPVLQLALHLWYRDHVPPRLGPSRLEQAAAALTLDTAGRFTPRAFRPFLTAYSAAKMHGDSFNTDIVMNELMRAISASLSSGASLMFQAEINGRLEFWDRGFGARSATTAPA